MSIGVAKQTFKVKCDTLGCKKQSGWIVGNLSQRHTCSNYCDDCMDELSKQLGNDSSNEEMEKALQEIQEKMDEFVSVADQLEEENNRLKEKMTESEIAKDIFNAMLPDGNVNKAELVEIALKHGIEANEEMKKSEILLLLVGEKEEQTEGEDQNE